MLFKDNWGKLYPDAKGIHQSPINILSNIAIYDDLLDQNPIVLNYEQKCFKELKNNGHTFVISGDSLSSTGNRIPLSL